MIKRTNIKLALLASVCFFSYEAKAAEIATNAALMQAMDKVTGRVNKITVPVNSKVAYGDFSLVLRACKKRPAEETPENFAFVDVTDKSFGIDEYNIFRGWLLSSAPGINAIEHPIYDIWLLECINTEVDNNLLLSQEELDARDSLPAKKRLQENTEAVEQPDTETVEPHKTIHIKEFINEDRDIEKDIQKVPSYIIETPTSDMSDIDEGEEPENLLLFTKMQENNADNDSISEDENNQLSDDDFSAALDAELNRLQKNKR